MLHLEPAQMSGCNTQIRRRQMLGNKLLIMSVLLLKLFIPLGCRHHRILLHAAQGNLRFLLRLYPAKLL